MWSTLNRFFKRLKEEPVDNCYNFRVSVNPFFLEGIEVYPASSIGMILKSSNSKFEIHFEYKKTIADIKDECQKFRNTNHGKYVSIQVNTSCFRRRIDSIIVDFEELKDCDNLAEELLRVFNFVFTSMKCKAEYGFVKTLYTSYYNIIKNSVKQIEMCLKKE